MAALGGSPVDLTELLGERKSNQVGLAVCDDPPDAPRVTWPDDVLAAFQIPESPTITVTPRGNAKPYKTRAPGDHLLDEITPRAVALVIDDKNVPCDLAWLDEKGQRTTAQWPSGRPLYLGGVSVAPDGQRALATTRDDAFHIDLTTGQAEVIHKRTLDDGFALNATGFLDHGARWAVLSDKRLHILDPDSRQYVAQDRSGGSNLLVARDGSVLLKCALGNKAGVYVFAHDKLKRVGNFGKLYLYPAFETAGRLLFRGKEQVHYEVTHLDEVFEAWVAPLRRKARKAAPASQGAAKPSRARKNKVELTLTPVARAEIPAPSAQEATTEVSQADLALLPDTHDVHKAHTGRLVGRAEVVNHITGACRRVRWRDPGGEVRELVPLTNDDGSPGAIKQLAMAPSGEFVFVTAIGQTVSRVSVREDGMRTCEEVLALDWKRTGNVMQCVPMDDDNVIVVGKKLVLWRRRDEAGAWHDVHEQKVTEGWCGAWLPGHRLVAVFTQSKYKTQLFEPVKDKLRKVARFVNPAWGALERGDDVYLVRSETDAWHLRKG